MPSIPLDTYEGAASHARAIREQLVARQMPPWYADPEHSLPFRNDPRLSAAELNTVITWIDAGAPRIGFPPVAVTKAAASDWSDPHGRAPDVVFSLPAMQLPANGEIPYVRRLLKVNVPHNSWISAIQALPGNPAVVHHMGIAEVSLAPSVTAGSLGQLNDVERRLGMPEGTLARPRPSVLDPFDPALYDMLAAYTPGSTYERYAAGSAKLLKAGPDQYISFNIHYTTTGQPAEDQSRLGLWLTAKPPVRQLFRAPMPGKTIIANGRELLSDDPGTRAEGTQFAIPPIPAFADHFELVGVTALLRPMTIYALQPHAHLRGRSFRYAVVYPDGHEQVLLDVPQYDFHWQLTYQLRDSLTLPAGSTLVITGRYDNSTHNAHLAGAAALDPLRRCGPDKLVRFREQNQTWDEMFSPIVEYAVDLRSQATGAHARAAAQLVATAGCLTQSASGTWSLQHAHGLEPAASQSTSHAETASLLMRQPGSLAIPLIGVGPFNASQWRGQRVIAKGVVIRDAQEPRLNLTSLQSAGARCP
ncbi:MAG TPA: hypothetical protein VIE42_01245 [Steroidobacteraceae bacterium]|jgi:hypothetical protein